MKLEIRWWQRYPILLSLYLRELRAPLTLVTGYSLLIAGLATFRSMAEVVEVVVVGILILSFMLVFPMLTASFPETVALSVERTRRGRVLELAVSSHIAVLEFYLDSQLGSLRNELLVAHSLRLGVDLDEPHRERAIDLVLHTIRLSFADLMLTSAGKERDRERGKYEDNFRGCLKDGSTALGGIVDFMAARYDGANDRLVAEARIWMLHGSRWDAIERHPTLVRFIEVTSVIAIAVIVLVIFRAIPYIGL